MTSIQSVAQTPNPGEIISLFRFDATFVGGDVYYVCMNSEGADGVTFGGVQYTPVDIEFTDLETNGQGVMPSPHVKVANTNGVFQSIINTYGDMLGCTIQRVRTFKRFLDGQPDADPTAYYGPDWFRVERKVAENPLYIEWELSASIDQEGKNLPGRQVIRHTCMWRYRMWNSADGSFDYSKAQCPFAGGQYFDISGNPTTPEKDRCGRRVSDCQLRFGENAPLPFGGFPGVARIRQ